MEENEKLSQLSASLASNEMEHKSFRRRLDEHDAALKQQSGILVALERQGNAIERVVESVGRVEKKVTSIDERVADLEREPGEKWKKIVFEIAKYLVIAVVAAAAGYFFKN